MEQHYYKQFRNKYIISLATIPLFLLLVAVLISIIVIAKLSLMIFAILLLLLMNLGLFLIIKSLRVITPKKFLRLFEQGELVSKKLSEIQTHPKNRCIIIGDRRFYFNKQTKEDIAVESILYSDKLKRDKNSIDILYFSDTESFIILNKFQLTDSKVDK